MSAPIIRSAHVRRSPEDAFRVFTTEIGAWWPLPTHGMFGDSSSSVMFRDGHVVEVSNDGTEAVWGQARTWNPPTTLVIAWHPGRSADDASEVEVRFIPDGSGTNVVLEHRGWEKFGSDAMERRRSYVGPNAWGYVLDHFADGAEARGDAPDLDELTAAYESFFALAESGDFGPAPAGEWDADTTIAHVALNDLAMNQVCQALVHGKTAGLRFENQICHDAAALRGWIESAGNRTELVARGRATALQVRAGLRRLSDEQRAALVHCRLTHDGNVMVDEPRPWGAIAIVVQAQVHLPAHVEQVANLRQT